MVATFKIIPLAVPGAKVDAACAELRANTPFEVKPFAEYAVSLIATELPSLKISVMDKTARILERRLEGSGNRLLRERRVPHETKALAASIKDVMAISEQAPKFVIVFGASAVIDEADVIPQAIREAGGKHSQRRHAGRSGESDGSRAHRRNVMSSALRAAPAVPRRTVSTGFSIASWPASSRARAK